MVQWCILTVMMFRVDDMSVTTAIEHVALELAMVGQSFLVFVMGRMSSLHCQNRS